MLCKLWIEKNVKMVHTSRKRLEKGGMHHEKHYQGI